MDWKKTLQNNWPLVFPFTVFSITAWKLQFLQDDAYITYRYVANFLNGDGLVYNIGEKIEGFTNFGWTVYLILWGALGQNFILISQITGFLFGLGIIALTYTLGQKIFNGNKFYSSLASLLVGFNLSLAHWSPAGLETAAFAFFAFLSVLLFIHRSWWLILSILMAVWIRPDGVVIAAILIIIEALQSRSFPKFTVISNVVAFVLSIPFVAFKFLYYGALLPNPFYAKTGFNLTQLTNGLEYTWTYISDYGFFGASFLIPLLFYKNLSRAAKTVWYASILFTLYVILIGGDVLKVHRFFLPILGANAILTILSLQFLVEKYLARSLRVAAAFIVTAGLILLTIYLPYQFVQTYNSIEKGFTNKMQTKAIYMKESDSTNFSVAVPTIGIFGYELIGHRVVDMLGLTDSTIAKHSEEPIEGMQTTWKEAKHNSAYLLSSNLDYIIFSTDLKPSAPAERALLLYPQFINDYRTVGWFYQANPNRPEGTLIIAYKRAREIKGPYVATYPVQWVEYYKQGLDAYGRGDMQQAISLLEKALKASPKPYYPYPLYQMAYCYMQLNEHEKAIKLNEAVLAQDSTVYESHKDLYIYARFKNDWDKAALHQRWLEKLVPWYWPRLKVLVDQTIVQANQTVR